jgi:hypothetical protein
MSAEMSAAMEASEAGRQRDVAQAEDRLLRATTEAAEEREKATHAMENQLSQAARHEEALSALRGEMDVFQKSAAEAFVQEKIAHAGVEERERRLESLERDKSLQIEALQATLKQAGVEAAKMESDLRGELENASARREKSESEASSGLREALAKRDRALTEAKIETERHAEEHKEAFAQMQATLESVSAEAASALPVQLVCSFC